MLSLPDRAAVERAIANTLDQCLASLLEERLAISIKNGIADMTHYVVVDSGDTEADVIHQVGFSPLVNPVDGIPFKDPAFHPWWDWLGRLGSRYEMIITMGNDGFAFILLIDKNNAAFGPLCSAYA